jgi:hypothetical protein
MYAMTKGAGPLRNDEIAAAPCDNEIAVAPYPPNPLAKPRRSASTSAATALGTCGE